MQEKRNTAVGPQIRTKKRSASKALQISLTAAALILGFSAATQNFAHEFDYHAALGNSFHHLYFPWKILEWAALYANEYSGEVQRAQAIGLMIATSIMLLNFMLTITGIHTSKASEFIHGSARWANKKDIEAAGLFSNEGVYVGAWRDKGNQVRYLRHNGPEHILCYAPTRSGKGVGLVVPTLLSWQHSAVVLDLKGELWEMSAGWRREYAENKVLRFEPANPAHSIGFNPLEEIRIGTEYEVGDVQNLATLIVDPDGRGLNDHWQKTAQSLLVGAILHLLYKSKANGKIANLALLDAMFADPEKPVDELWQEMTTYLHMGEKPHPVVAAAGRDMIDRAHEEAGSVLSTAKSYLSLYRDPAVAKIISKSEFRIADLMNYHDPVSLYIVTQPSDKTRLRPLVRIIVNMILRLLANRMEFENGRPVPHYKHRLLMLLDEFPSLGRLEIMQESLAFVAGYGIKCYLIVQDINQLQNSASGYGREESITSNCHIQIAFPPNRVETAEHLSKLTGQTTIVKNQITASGRRISPILGQVSRTFQEVQRALLTVDESMRMPGPVKDHNGLIKEPGDMVIYCAGFPAIYGQQPLYFKDPIFQRRAEIPAPKMTDRLAYSTLTIPRKAA